MLVVLAFGATAVYCATTAAAPRNVLVHEADVPDITVYELPVGPQQMIWSGAQVTGSDWVVYSGLTHTLNGKDIDDEGWRLRFLAGIGRYTYQGTPHDHDAARPTRYVGHHAFGNFLIGYHQQLGNLTLKTFAGIASANHVVFPVDPHNATVGYTYGITGALEAWWNITPFVWLDSNAAYSTIFDSFNANARLGYRVVDDISLGLEAGTVGNDGYAALHAAAFTRIEFSNMALRLSAGSSADRNSDIRPFAAVNFEMKF